ncbi:MULTISPECIES: ACP S-malonyltransferase [Bacillus]|uniref:ACP S-malonyltransferase n=1 Tax=Bacillus TaxID=1386 RepID=UPI0009D83B68|nr:MULTISPECIES: ACP S-malonyltransferase [Bacillus]PEC24851.1 [acyl-carrier-protein] S-malonyltransferase [Bacillus thuringiensis]SMD40778.1 [acyl-carrier-protein] S-malonyltransferase [Bacillus sp. JKS001846]
MGKLAFLFSGQGSQYVGMGKQLYESFPIARQTFEEANDVLSFNLKKLCFEGDIDTLTQTENAQPAILTVSTAAYRVYMNEIGIMPDYMAGHSLGEISALSCAGAIDFKDAVKIARRRGQLMQEAVMAREGGMLAIIGLGRKIVEEASKQFSKKGNLVVVSNSNSAEQHVISGHSTAIEEAGKYLQSIGAKLIPVKVSAPFHSPLMQPAADKFYYELQEYKFNNLNVNVISNVTAQLYPNKDSIIDYLVKQVVYPVEWKKSMDYLDSQNTEFAVEMGPNEVLTKLMKKNIPYIKTIPTDIDLNIESLKKEIKSRKYVPQFILRCLGIAVSTPNFNWNEEEYQQGVVEPYRKMKEIQENLEREGKEAEISHMKEAIDLLLLIFKSKKTPIEERKSRLNQLFLDTNTQYLFTKQQFEDKTLIL